MTNYRNDFCIMSKENLMMTHEERKKVMMKRIGTTIMLMGTALLLTSCSISNFTAGVIAEGANETAVVHPSKLKSIRPGTAIVVTLKESGSAQGEFLGVKNDPQSPIMVLKTESNLLHIDVNKVRTIQTCPRRDPKLTGLLISAAVEAVAIMFFAKSMK
jgi:hypothetical protein